jgi:trans-aconitate 2-methyltransferase
LFPSVLVCQAGRMPRDGWDPGQYERFLEERRAPFFDLLALVRPRPGMRVVDLGCGTGELTRILHDRLGAAETLGVDRSAAMLERSRDHAGADLRFAERDLREALAPESYDLVFSNAALHWIPDHPDLFGRITRALTPGGQLAVQMPANADHPSHTVAAELASEPPFRNAFGAEVAQPGVLDPVAYALLLERLGHRFQHVRMQVYLHRLESPADVVEWVKGTLLTAYQQRLSADLYDRFLAAYRARLLARLDDVRPYPYPFKRILLWAQKE